MLSKATLERLKKVSVLISARARHAPAIRRTPLVHAWASEVMLRTTVLEHQVHTRYGLRSDNADTLRLQISQSRV